MRRLRYTSEAQRDLADIADYILRESSSRANAERFTAQLRAQCRKLASLPATIGRARPELVADIRSFAFKGYVIFFRYRDDVFEVVNVLEGHRDIPAYFKDDDVEDI